MTTIRNILADPTRQQKKVLEKLIMHHASLRKEELITSYDTDISDDIVQQIYAGYTAFTVDKKPLEYILGFVEFYQRRFRIDGRSLIPRPETEYMIEAVCEHVVQLQGNTDTRTPQMLIDVGTGSGVLGLSVLLEHPGFFAYGVLAEFYPATLSLAQENAALYHDKIIAGNTHEIAVLESNLIGFTEHEPRKSRFLTHTITLVANLPYIPDETFDTQTADNVRLREPRPAFVGGDDGLDFYREMFAQIFASRDERHSSEGEITGSPEVTGSYQASQSPIVMFLEMMTRQVDILRREYETKISFEEIKTFHFNIRIVKAVVV